MAELARSRRLFVSHQWVGVNVGRWYVAVGGPTHRPLFSERNRTKCRVVPLGGGWRIIVRPRRCHHVWEWLPTLDTNPEQYFRECEKCERVETCEGVTYLADGRTIPATEWREPR